MPRLEPGIYEAAMTLLWIEDGRVMPGHDVTVVSMPMSEHAAANGSKEQ
jgi:hypothetical protein